MDPAIIQIILEDSDESLGGCDSRFEAPWPKYYCVNNI
jgi:hypothetical protein